MTKESIYELQKIDCNCNDCFYMTRDFDRYKKWEEFHRQLQLDEFTKKQERAIESAIYLLKEATTSDELKSADGLYRKAKAMKFQFDREGFINYGDCSKFNKQVSFLPQTCQVETQHCFVHRKDFVNQ